MRVGALLPALWMLTSSPAFAGEDCIIDKGVFPGTDENYVSFNLPKGSHAWADLQKDPEIVRALARAQHYGELEILVSFEGTLQPTDPELKDLFLKRIKSLPAGLTPFHVTLKANQSRLCALLQDPSVVHMTENHTESPA